MIVLVINSVPTGKNGITNVIFNYLSAMDMDDLRVDYISMNQPEDIYIEKVESKGGKVYVLPRTLKNCFGYWRNLRKLVEKNCYDIVHIHGNSHTLILELSAIKSGGCPISFVHAHNTYCKYPFLHKVLSPIFHSLCTYGFACGTEAGKYMFGKHPFRILNNGIETKRFAFDEEKRDVIRRLLDWGDCSIVGHVGSFSPVKNHRFIINVFEYKSGIIFRS